MGRTRLVLVCVLAVAASVPAFAADDFYEQQLRTGKADFQANRLPQSADEFRIAAFGLLERPALLAEALVRLAVAQNALGQTIETSRTIDRFVEVEQRFSPYANVPLEPSVKSKFEELVVKQVPRATLQSLSSMARLVKSDLQRIAELPSGQRLAAYEAAAQREPKNVEYPLALTREAAARDGSADVIRWGNRVLELDPANKDVRPLLAHARADRKECKEAIAILKDLDLSQRPELYADQAVCFAEMSRWKDAEIALASVPESLKTRGDVRRATQLVTKANDQAKAEQARLAKAQATPAPTSVQTRGSAPVPQTSSATAKPVGKTDAVDASRKLIRDGSYTEAVKVLKPAVQAEPDSRPLRLALLESAVLARDWRTASSQVPNVTPLTSGEELYMFYASVALYETGRHDEAKMFMEKAKSRMVPSPMVDYYLKAVLGTQRGS